MKRRPQYRVYLIIAVILVLVTSAFCVRFYRLSELGFWDDDSLNYTKIAKLWFFDHNFANPYAKPAYHVLGCLAIKLVGFYDFTLLYLSNFLDIITILLIVLVARLTGIRWILSISAAFLYAFLPFILTEATRALPHLSSSTFFMAAFCLFLAYLNSERRRRVYLFFCGALVVFAGNIHPTLYSGAVFFFLILAGLSFPRFNPAPDTLKGVKDVVLYMAGCVVVYAILVFIASGGDLNYFERFTGMVKQLSQYRGLQDHGHLGTVFSKFIYTLKITPEMLTAPVSILFVLIIFFQVGLWVKGCRSFSKDMVAKFWLGVCADAKARNMHLLWGMILFFLLSFFVGIRGLQARFMIPVVPLVILGFVAYIELLSSRYPKLHLGAVFFVFAITMSGYNVITNIDMIKKPTEASRQIANVLADKVDQFNRVLVTPRGLHQSYLETAYIDGTFVYHLQKPWKPELDKLKRYNIRYIVVVKPSSRYVRSDRNSEYFNAEYVQILQGIEEIGAITIYHSDVVLIVEIPYSSNISKPFYTSMDNPFFWITRVYEPVYMKKNQ